MDRRIIVTTGAPAPVGPYSQAIWTDGWLHLAGQIGLDPATGRLVDGGLDEEIARAMRNVDAVLAAAGGGWANVSTVTVYLVEEEDFPRFNRVYADHLPSGVQPARTTIIVKALPLGAKVEMTAVARIATPRAPVG